MFEIKMKQCFVILVIIVLISVTKCRPGGDSEVKDIMTAAKQDVVDPNNSNQHYVTEDNTATNKGNSDVTKKNVVDRTEQDELDTINPVGKTIISIEESLSEYVGF